MAGIGFELKRVIKEGSLASVIEAYGYSAVLSSGPWLASILALSLIGYIAYDPMSNEAIKFQIAVTYIFAFSLTFSSLLQLPFVRYVADRLYEKKDASIVPNYAGVLILIMGGGMLIMLPLALYLLKGESFLFIMLFVASFVTLCGIWIGNLVLTGIRRYKSIILLYVVSYGAVVLLSIFLKKFGIEGLMASFFIGSAILFGGFSSLIYYNYPTKRLVEFDFLSKGKFFYSLALIGFFYNAAIWVDKFIFWFHPMTSFEVTGQLRASMIYDLPIFLAYLLMTPGIAIFFYRYEADFMYKYGLTGTAMNQGGTLGDIIKYKGDMIKVIRMALLEVIVVQGMLNVFIFITLPAILWRLNIPELYIPILHVDIVGAQLLLCFMIVFSMLLCLDCRREAMLISISFLMLNMIFSNISIIMGPYYYGYGFSLALLVSGAVGLFLLRANTDQLEYKTFMLRH